MASDHAGSLSNAGPGWVGSIYMAIEQTATLGQYGLPLLRQHRDDLDVGRQRRMVRSRQAAGRPGRNEFGISRSDRRHLAVGALELHAATTRIRRRTFRTRSVKRRRSCVSSKRTGRSEPSANATHRRRRSERHVRLCASGAGAADHLSWRSRTSFIGRSGISRVACTTRTPSTTTARLRAHAGCAGLRLAVLAPIAWPAPPPGYGPWEQVAFDIADGMRRARARRHALRDRQLAVRGHARLGRPGRAQRRPGAQRRRVRRAARRRAVPARRANSI